MTPKTITALVDSKIVQRPGEHHTELHERLRNNFINSFVTIREPTELITKSECVIDVSEILGIPDAVLVNINGCKHELLKKLHIHNLPDLGRDIYISEKNPVYSLSDLCSPLDYSPRNYVGRRNNNSTAHWMQTHPTIPGAYIYTLLDLGRDLTDLEKNAIYDSMGER